MLFHLRSEKFVYFFKLINVSCRNRSESDIMFRVKLKVFFSYFLVSIICHVQDGQNQNKMESVNV